MDGSATFALPIGAMDPQEYRFLINLDPHPYLGALCSVWVAPVLEGEVSLVESRLTPGNLSDFGAGPDSLLSKLVCEAERYQEKMVLDHFNRTRKVARSLEEYAQEPTRKKALQSYTDRWVNLWLEQAVVSGYTLCFGLRRGAFVHSQSLRYLRLEDRPELTFLRQPEGIRYRLRLFQGGQVWPILGMKYQALSVKHGWALLDRTLVHLEDTPASLLKPFTEKEEVFIPGKHVPVFMKGFLLRAAEKADVLAEGFEILEHTRIEGWRLGIIQDLFHGHYKCRQGFSYGGAWFMGYDARISHQRLVEQDADDYVIHRYVRNPAEEEERALALQQSGLALAEPGILHFSEGEKSAELADAAAWLVRHADELTAAGWQLEPLHTPQGILLPKPAKVVEHTLEEGNDWFDIHARVQVGEYDLPFTALRSSITEGVPFHALPDGLCFHIPADWFQLYADWFVLGEIAGEQFRLTRAQYLSIRQKGTIATASESVAPSVEWEKVPAPAALQATLRPYQEAGFAWLAGLYNAGLGACLADDMGLGKTIQTIALLLHIQEGLTPSAPLSAPVQMDLFGTSAAEETVSPVGALIIAPSSLLYNWESELRRFAPSLRVLMHSGSQRFRDPGVLSRQDVLITSYALVVRDAELLSRIPLRCAILDESQHIKNRDSKTFKAVHRLHTDVRITLTGTPIENSLSDLWSQMQFINPGLLGQYEQFRTHYQTPIERKGDEEKREALKQLVRPFLLRRRKEEVARDLPALHEQIVWCDMHEAQAACYEEERNAVRRLLLRQLETGQSVGAPVVLNALMRLRQIANYPAILPEYAEIPSGKAEVLCGELETIARSGHRALVFSAFLQHLRVYRNWLEQNSIPYDTLTGEDSAVEKKAAEDALQQERVQFLLLTLKAGGAGLNLTAADYVLLADPWWNPAVEKQAVARAHRIGQTRPVLALRFITRGTIEEKILRLQERKQQWSDDLIDEPAFLQGLLPEELRDLVS